MQHSPYEIKEKLLQALDNEYNVVDMDAVLGVITALEQALITKDALERTRIGKYINELRKRTDNEQLARRAKELVKSWRRLLPQTPQRINGEDSNHGLISSPGSNITVLGPGPGPGVGPGPGPGNRLPKLCISVPETPKYKTSSPSMMVERSSSPYFSSASNSPLLVSSVLQGSSLPSMPTNYAPCKVVVCQTNQKDTNSVNNVILNTCNQSNEVNSIKDVKSVSLSDLQQTTMTESETSILPSRTYLNTSPDLKSSSSSSSPLLSASSNPPSRTVSPTLALESNQDLCKMNSDKECLQNEIFISSSSTSPELNVIESKTKISNGISDTTENILPSESSALSSVILCNSNSLESDKTLFASKTPKRKRSLDKNELHDNRIGEMFASLNSSKLPKVKTTQQIIADLQAKKGFSTVLSPESLSSIDSLHTSEAEVSQTKSELLKKFLIASQSARNESNGESPLNDCNVSLSECGSHSVPDVTSVINTNLNVSSCISYPDPVDEEIKTMLSALPPIPPIEEVNLENSTCLNRPSSVTEYDLNRLHERWEYVNGVYDCNGVWKPWLECTEQKSYLNESFQIMPYVNID